MKWILVAIILVIVPYTFLTLRYRKPGPAFQPYEDMKNRANVARLLSAGYQRIPVVAQRPADRTHTPDGAGVSAAPGGVPEDLRSTLVEPLRLPGDYGTVRAAASVSALLPYPIEFTCSLPDDQQQLGGAELYLKGDALVVAPTFEQVGGGLQTRSRQTIVLITVPAGTLKPGRYTVTLPGERASRAWTLEVR